MKRFLIFAFFILYSSILISQVLVGVNGKFVTVQEYNGFIDIKSLESLGFSIVISNRSERAYLIYKNQIIIVEKSGTVTVDFLDIYENAALYTSDKIMISVDLLSKILGLSKYVTPAGMEAFIDKVCVLTSVDYSHNELKLDFMGSPFEEMLEIKSEESKVVLELSPVLSEVVSTDQIKINQNGYKLQMEIFLDTEAKPVLSTKLQDNSFIITVSFPQLGREQIAKGVYWEQKVEKIGNKDMLVNYLWIDPQFVDLKPEISSGGIGSLESVEKMVIRKNAVAGVNANYFDTNTGLPIGLLIVDGKILSMPYGDRPVFIQTFSNEVYISRIYFDVNIKVGQLLFLVKGINTIAQGEVLIFTPEFGLSIPYRDEMVYFSVVDGKVNGTGWLSKAPKNGFVLAISSKYKKYLEGIQIGDTVEYIVNTNFPYPIKHAIEAGPLILYEGSPIPDRNDEKNRYGGSIARASATRTLAATLPDGKVVLAVINDQDGSGGVNYDELVEFSLKKGFYSAMNFDGGSSSIMVIFDRVVSKVPTGWVRAVPASLLVVKKDNK
ncbi:phosphodiester glycosidase family protein [Pseudothermotoga elfii]